MLLLWTSQIFAQLPEGYTQELISEEYSNPIDVEFHPSRDDIMIVAERGGKIWISDLVNGVWVKRNNPIIDITNQVTTYSERGVQSIILSSHYIYVYYTVEETYLLPGLPEVVEDNSATINRVSRWEISWPQNIEFGEEIIVGTTPSDGIPSVSGNHQGGGMAWGEFNYLFISTGDGSSGIYNQQAISRGIMRAELNVSGPSKSQIVNSANGKLLRVQGWDGKAPPSNPFYDLQNPRSPESRMYAMGFRNPFDIVGKPYKSVNDQPTTIYVADVGASNKEEVSVIDKGGLNAGWGLREGFNIRTLNGTNPDEGIPYSDLMVESTSFIDDNDDTQRRYKHHVPELDYGHNSEPITRLARFTNDVLDPIIDENVIGGNAITGGALIVGDGFGSIYNNAYIFSDSSTGWLNIALPSNDPDNGNYFSSTINFLPSGSFFGPVDITQNPHDGSIYIVSLYGGGSIDKIYYNETLSTPIAELEDSIKIVYDLNYNLNTIIGIKSKADLTISDISGKKIINLEIYDNHVIDFNLASGIYLAQITIDNISVTKKFIIK